MSTIEGGILTGASLSLVIFLLSIIFCAANVAKVVYYRLNSSNIISVQKNVSAFAMYENRLVDGNSVQYFIDTYGDDLFIRVATEASPTGVTNDALVDSKNLSSAAYVNPICEFHCTLLYDHNGDVIGANFEQDGLKISEDVLRQAIEECRR